MLIHHAVNLSGLRRASTATNVRLSLAATFICLSTMALAQTVVPNDPPMTSCKVAPIEIANWFTSGTITPNGGVDPADSVIFPNVPNCSFYKWSEQMFLWLTSPAPSKYGPGTHVFNSPVFYNVDPPDASGKRTFSPNVPGRFRDFSVRISQLGPLHKPVVFDRTGKMFTVVRPEAGPTGKPVIRNKANQPVEIERTEVAPNGKPVFRDKAGKAIDFQVARNGNPRLLDKSGKAIDFSLKKISINGRPFFLDGAGNVIETEQGQADGNVLMAQNGSLVYYALQTNDVYTYFLTGQKNGAISATKFPTTPTDLNNIITYGLAHSKVFPDDVALAIELKSSWIETTGLDLSKYVTMTATIPNYIQTTPLLWTASGTRQAQLALVGMHVVGSTAGHPEMIWATFEHVNNTRNTQYTYTNSASGTTTIPQEPGGTWTFSTPTATATPNQSLIGLSGANLVAASPPTPIGPADILRINPWGMPGGSTASNTELVSINHSVISQLAPTDVRTNYIMTGSTWTAFGQNPPPGPGFAVGTNQMANSTMETFQQPSNCFDCHTGSNMLGTMSGGLSHIYGPLIPLFPP